MDLPVESSLFDLLAGFCAAGAGLGCLYFLCTSVLLLWQDRRSSEGDASAQPLPVTILKPLYGDEPDLYARLSTFCRQDYSAPVQIVFGVQDAADPAIAVVERLKADFPDVAIDLKIDPRSHGSNRKISNVVNMVTLARHPILFLVDSDIEVTQKYVSTIVAELQKPGVGVVTCLYHGLAANNVWAQLSRLAVNAQFLPNAITAINLGLARPCFGSTIALRREMLNRIGGFQAFADCLADDYAIGDAVRAAGYDIAIPAFTVGHVCVQNSLSEVLLSDLRCARTIKSVDPIGHLGTLLGHPFALALIGSLLGSVDAMFLAIIALACRVALLACIERVFDVDRHPYWLVPIRDLLSFGVFIASFFGSAVNWRGYRYRVLSNGKLIQDSNSVQP